MVPSGWNIESLGSVTNKVGSGVTPRGGSNSYKSSGIPLIRSQNILWGKLDLSDVAYIDDKQHNKMKGSFVYKDDVLLNITGASIGRVAVSNIDEANVNQHVCIIRSDKLDSGYLKSFLLSFEGQKQVEQCQAGGNRQGLNFEQIKSFKIPFPPLPEQQKIAKILSTWDNAINATERLIDNSTEQKKALMQQLLTGKKRLLDESGERFEGEWEEVSLEHHMESFTNGYAFSASKYQLSGIPIITMGNIGLDGKFNERTHKQNFWQSDSSLDKFLIAKDDLLIAMTDVTPDKNLIGRMTIVTADKSFYLNQRVGLIRLKPSLNRHFLRCLSNSTDWRKYSVAVSASGVQANMSTKDIKKGKIKLPTIFEQQKIATVLTNADKEIELLEQQLADLQQEKKALMQVLLTGKKRVVVDGEVV